jgi:nucleoid DNA-binding protein
MNKGDLVDKIAAGCGLTKTQAASAIDTTVESVTQALKKPGGADWIWNICRGGA